MKTQEYEQGTDKKVNRRKKRHSIFLHFLTWIYPGKNKTVIGFIGTQKGFNATIARQSMFKHSILSMLTPPTSSFKASKHYNHYNIPNTKT